MSHLNVRQSRRALVEESSLGSRILRMTLLVLWQLIRLPCCALLILMEPIVRAVLVPLAFVGFVITLIFGFLIGDPKFPRWGMLGFSVGALMLYWVYLGLMSLFLTLPPIHDR